MQHVAEIAGALIANRGILGACARDDPFELGGGRVERAIACTGEQLGEDDAQRVDVGARVGHEPGRLFRREVPGCADDDARFGECFRARRLRDAEVGDLDFAGIGDEQVARLHVAVHDAVRVRVFERAGDLRADRCYLARRQRATSVEDVAQAVSVDQLHHEVGAVRVFAPVVDRHHVRVVEARGRARLAPEALARARRRRRRKLHRDRAVEQHVERGEDLAHAAHSDERNEAVAAAEHISHRGHEPNIPTQRANCLRGPAFRRATLPANPT